MRYVSQVRYDIGRTSKKLTTQKSKNRGKECVAPTKACVAVRHYGQQNGKRRQKQKIQRYLVAGA